jgi:hypothetical protein|tara:strand:- start:2535 stop:3437 length:903 start_codon:yes stop_codon:yes gene_type:complete
MSIAFFTEMGFEGKVPRNHPNMRTEFAWMCALDADHYNYKSIPNKEYDLGIVIIPKKNPNFDLNILKKYCNKVAVMQEGPHWYFQDYSLDKQIWYYNTLTSADIIFTHNKIDKKYYEGLTNHKDVRVLQSLMIEDSIGKIKEVEREGIIIGGNFVNWYGGFDSYIVASEHFDKVVAPSMGRKQSGEEQLLTHLPYLNWKEWIHKLNEFKIGIHLMRTHAAGTFALNCAYLGIPCIGYKGLDTQEICHPDLTIKVGNLTKAKKLLGRLKNNSYFYNKMSSQARENYKKYYHENIFNSTFKK